MMYSLWRYVCCTTIIFSCGSVVKSFVPKSYRDCRLTEQHLRAAVDDGNFSNISFDALSGKRILVVGGSGRVGGSVVSQLIKRGASHVTVGGTNEDRFENSRARWIQMFGEKEKMFKTNVDFVRMFRDNEESVSRALQESSYDLVVNTAGPFQGKVMAKNGVLEAALMNKVPYIDVCDDYCTSRVAKTKYAVRAQELGVPCLISTGCWVSRAKRGRPTFLLLFGPKFLDSL